MMSLPRPGDLLPPFLQDSLNLTAAQKKQLEALSRTDGLTGLFNRSHWQNCLDAEFARSRRLNTPVALLMVDLDHFKSINDRFGHAAGDEVLRRAAALLRANLRCVDVVGRYGGEEFAVILPHTDGAAAQVVAERLRRALAGRDGRRQRDDDEKRKHAACGLEHVSALQTSRVRVIMCEKRPRNDRYPSRLMRKAAVSRKNARSRRSASSGSATASSARVIRSSHRSRAAPSMANGA